MTKPSALAVLRVLETVHATMLEPDELQELTERGLVTHTRQGFYALTWAGYKLTSGADEVVMLDGETTKRP